MNNPWLLLPLAAGGLAVVLIVAISLRRLVRRRRRVQARERFPALRPEAERQFLEAASASGKPRGLRWKDIQFHEGQVFAVDRVSGALYALVGATISFEAIEGGPMEDVEAVGNLRAATAVFVFQNGRWTTDGRAVFNLLPEETVERYGAALEAC